MEFWTIEVLDGQGLSAERWREAHGEQLVEAALTNRAQEWAWVSRGWCRTAERGQIPIGSPVVGHPRRRMRLGSL